MALKTLKTQIQLQTHLRILMFKRTCVWRKESDVLGAASLWGETERRREWRTEEREKNLCLGPGGLIYFDIFQNA